MSDLMAQLRANPHDFDLFQALSILERSEPERAAIGTSLGIDEAVRLASQVDLGFAASDIGSLRDSERDGPPLTLRTPALSLAGATGPLPMPFTELLLERRRMRDSSGLEFLDMFNQRVLGFLYRSRRKHHLALNPGSMAEAPLVRSLDALSGLGRAEGARAPGGEQAWLRHAGVQGAAPRSMASLLSVLRDRVGVHFSGTQFVGGWHALAPSDRARLHDQRQPSGMSSSARLGMGASLGARAWDQGAGMALEAPALKPERFAALMPGGKDNALLGWLVARHLQRDIQVELRLTLDRPPASKLGAVETPAEPLAPRLGISAWLCSPARPAPDAAARGAEAAAALAATVALYQAPRFVLVDQSPAGHAGHPGG